MPLSSEDWDKAKNNKPKAKIKPVSKSRDPETIAALLVFAENRGSPDMNCTFHDLAVIVSAVVDTRIRRRALKHLLIARDLLIPRVKAKSPKGPYQPPEEATIEGLELDERTARDSVLAVQALHKLGWDIEAALRAVKTVSKCEPCKGEGLVYKPERLKK